MGWRLAQKTVIGSPLLGVGGFDTICTGFASDNSTACRQCRLETPSASTSASGPMPIFEAFFSSASSCLLFACNSLFSFFNARILFCTSLVCKQVIIEHII